MPYPKVFTVENKVARKKTLLGIAANVPKEMDLAMWPMDGKFPLPKQWGPMAQTGSPGYPCKYAIFCIQNGRQGL